MRSITAWFYKKYVLDGSCLVGSLEARDRILRCFRTYFEIFFGQILRCVGHILRYFLDSA